MTVLGYGRAIHNAQPFDGQGVSLYVTSGTAVQYRRMRLGGRRSVLRQGWSGRNAKTLRVDSQAGVSDDQVDFAYDLSSLAAGTYTADVRHYLDNFENLTSNYATTTFEIDGAASEVAAIYGTVTWLAPEILSGGIVRLRWVWHPSDSGVQPTRFRIVYTAGPTSPSDITVDVVSGILDYETLTTALSDSSAYTVRLEAETDTETAIVATGKTFTADATGPATPTLVSISAR